MSDFQVMEPAHPLSAKEIQQLEDALIGALRDKGGHAGNTALMQQLNWPEERYWMIRDRLFDVGKLKRGRGKGGSVSVVEQGSVTAPQFGEDSKPQFQKEHELYRKEHELYLPILQSLRGSWKQNKALNEFECEITAGKGKKHATGTWSRPDLTAVSMVVYSHLPGKHFEVFTFEVKTSSEINILGVYEALAHRRRATQSYVIYHCNDATSFTEIMEEICEEAAKHGVGIIVAEDPADPKTWEEKVEPTRNSPDLAKLNEFIITMLSDATQQKFLMWFH